MSPERFTRLRVIGLTALFTSVGILAGAAAVLTAINRQTPPTPQLDAPPTSITITLYPLNDLSMEGSRPTAIPTGDFDRVMRLVTPDKFYEGGINDWITPLIAEVVITHEGRPDSRLLVRWSGKNPATISLDGRNYFYAKQHDDTRDGGMQLVAFVRHLGKEKAP